MPRLLLLAAAVAAAAPAPAADAPLTLVKTYEFPGKPGKLDHLAADPDGGKLYVANKPADELVVIDLKTGAVTVVPGQRKVSGVEYVPGLDVVVVGNGSGEVAGFKAADRAVAFTAKAAAADNVHYNPADKRVYAAHGSALSGFDTQTGGLWKMVALPGAAHGFVIDPTGGTTYVSLTGPGAVAVVSVGSPPKLTGTYPLKLAAGNSPITLDPAGRRLFVGCRRPACVLVLDADTGKELQAVPIPAGVDDVQFDAARKRVYASTDAGLAVLEQAGGEYRSLAVIETPKSARTCVFAGGKLYVGVPQQEKGGPAKVLVYEAN